MNLGNGTERQDGSISDKIKILPVIAVLKLIRCQWQLNGREEENDTISR